MLLLVLLFLLFLGNDSIWSMLLRGDLPLIPLLSFMFVSFIVFVCVGDCFERGRNARICKKREEEVRLKQERVSRMCRLKAAEQWYDKIIADHDAEMWGKLE